MNKQLQLTIYRRNVRRVIVGRHGLFPDSSRGIDRLVDNRDAFRKDFHSIQEWKSPRPD